MKYFNKSSCAVILALLLVIVASQSLFFNFLIDSMIGRAFFLFLIIIISYLNNHLGIICLLFLILMFSKEDLGFFENFENNSSGNNKNKAKAKAKARSNTGSAPGSQLGSRTNTSNSGNRSSREGFEGYNQVDQERNLQKGDNSNSLPVNKFMDNQDMVSAYEGFKEISSFSHFQ